ncbi:MAG: dephospho-CoA kinase [Leptolyngbyaceae cyanobacterium bins.59]|nr:dephospho-CoA kinase [Leptolyngbyaceae cyanobacterium bins.59]
MQQRSEPSQNRDRRIIGLTGGIGMGKTTIANYLASAYHLPTLDADLYAREAVQPDSQILAEIVERYGSGILLPNQELDRRRLGIIIFNNPAERLWLEQRIHPYVRDRFLEEIARYHNQPQPPTLVLVVPLLFEARMTDLVTEIWVVYCPAEIQVERLIQRDRNWIAGDELTVLQAIQARIESQMPIEKKLAEANVVLDNSSTPEVWMAQVDQAMNNLQSTCPLAPNCDSPTVPLGAHQERFVSRG